MAAVDPFRFYVYTHEFSNGVVYVGKGCGGRSTRYTSGRNRFWKSLYKKYGEPVVEIVESGLNESSALQLEIDVIMELRNHNFRLANFTDGGGGLSGYKHTEATRKKMSETRLAMPIEAKYNTPSQSSIAALVEFNRTNYTDERRKKLSLSHSGEKNYFFGKIPHAAISAAAGKNSIPVVMIVGGIVIAEYESAEEAHRATGINPGNIRRCATGKRKSAGKTPCGTKITWKILGELSSQAQLSGPILDRT